MHCRRHVHSIRQGCPRPLGHQHAAVLLKTSGVGTKKKPLIVPFACWSLSLVPVCLCAGLLASIPAADGRISSAFSRLAQVCVCASLLTSCFPPHCLLSSLLLAPLLTAYLPPHSRWPSRPWACRCTPSSSVPTTSSTDYRCCARAKHTIRE